MLCFAEYYVEAAESIFESVEMYNPLAKKKAKDQMNQEGSSRQGIVVTSEPLEVEEAEELLESQQMPSAQAQSSRPQSQKQIKGKNKKDSYLILCISVHLHTHFINLIFALQQFLNRTVQLHRGLVRNDWLISTFQRKRRWTKTL